MADYRIYLRKIVLVGLFVALGIVLQVYSIQLPIARIGFSPVPTIIAGIILGPVFGAITGLLKDVVGFIIAPPASGAGFSPHIAFIQMMYGVWPFFFLAIFKRPVDLVWGLALKGLNARETNNRVVMWLRGIPSRLVVCYLTVAATQFVNGGLLMPAALNLLIDGRITYALWLARFTTRIPQQVVFLIAYPAVTYAVVEAFSRMPHGVRAMKGVIHAAPLSRHS